MAPGHEKAIETIVDVDPALVKKDQPPVLKKKDIVLVLFKWAGRSELKNRIMLESLNVDELVKSESIRFAAAKHKRNFFRRLFAENKNCVLYAIEPLSVAVLIEVP